MAKLYPGKEYIPLLCINPTDRSLVIGNNAQYFSDSSIPIASRSSTIAEMPKVVEGMRDNCLKYHQVITDTHDIECYVANTRYRFFQSCIIEGRSRFLALICISKKLYKEGKDPFLLENQTIVFAPSRYSSVDKLSSKFAKLYGINPRKNKVVYNDEYIFNEAFSGYRPTLALLDEEYQLALTAKFIESYND